MAWVDIMPRYQSLFRQHGWDSASAFLSWTGVLVNRHRTRQVEQVEFEPEAQARDGASLAGASGSVHRFFLKKENAVTWRDLFRNAWHGFGWCATAVREAATLQALRKAGIGCPEVVALGEDGRHAFMVTRDESAMPELRAILPTLADDERNRLADALGHELARMHDAGFDHPDLFAKHVLVSAERTGFRFCILDWQRSRRRRTVSWHVRCRDLAALDATLHVSLAGYRLRLRFLRAYARATTQAERLPFGRLARQVRPAAEHLRQDRNIREIGQLPTPPHDQQFVALHEGRLLIVRSFFEKLDGNLPPWLIDGSEPEAQARDESATTFQYQAWPVPNTSWEIPPLAHTLFRLQRFGIPAPRLLAVGRADEHIFLVAETVTTVPFAEAFAKATPSVRTRMLRQAGWIIRQIHEAGYYLPTGETWTRRLGVVPTTGEIILAKVEPLLRGSVPWQELAPIEFSRQKVLLSRTEQLRFLQGYLKQRKGHERDRRRALTFRGSAVSERQAIS